VKTDKREGTRVGGGEVAQTMYARMNKKREREKAPNLKSSEQRQQSRKTLQHVRKYLQAVIGNLTGGPSPQSIRKSYNSTGGKQAKG
jgi:hypothetical protein